MKATPEIFAPSERQVVEKTSVVLARTIRAAILDGRLEPYQPLPEVELARQLGTSRTPIREALLILEREGLVEATPNRGSTVKGYDLAELEELYTLRAVLESHAASTAAARIEPRAVRRLEESCDRAHRLRESDAALSEHVDEIADENYNFHELILHAAGSERLRRMVREVTALPPIYRAYRSYSSRDHETVEAEHRAISQALREGDRERAAELMHAHVIWARNLALAHFPRSPEVA